MEHGCPWHGWQRPNIDWCDVLPWPCFAPCLAAQFSSAQLSQIVRWRKSHQPLSRRCEENLCGFITNPANAWSNLAYVLAAYASCRHGLFARRWFAPSLLFIAVSSFLYHASHTAFFQLFDFAAMCVSAVTSTNAEYQFGEQRPPTQLLRLPPLHWHQVLIYCDPNCAKL